MPQRQLEVRSYAKINLDLRVLHKSGGFHELRTVFQTVSLHDTIGIRLERARTSTLSIDDSFAIPDNLILRAARLVLEEFKVNARVHFTLDKRIPMGAGLGGGSSNAAAVLRALPGLLGKKLDLSRARELGAMLGSDVPFFLIGGTALGLGRGTELYPLPDVKPEPIVIVHTGIHVSTGPAYQALGRSENYAGSARAIAEFQDYVRELSERSIASAIAGVNDFEGPVFDAHPELRKSAQALKRAGSTNVRMSGSGSAIFGFFTSAAARDAAAKKIPGARAARLLTRSASIT